MSCLHGAAGGPCHDHDEYDDDACELRVRKRAEQLWTGKVCSRRGKFGLRPAAVGRVHRDDDIHLGTFSLSIRQLDNNQLTCIDEAALRSQKELEIL